jgi:hypothetical protein
MAFQTNAAQATKPSYQDPSYTTRQSYTLGKIGPGAASVAKFVTFANMYLYTLTTYIDVLGTSTFSSTLSGNTAQITIIVNTNTTGIAVGLTTTTLGPYPIGGPSIGTSTGTAVLGGVNFIPLNTSTGVGGAGGYFVPAFSEVVVTLGADATNVTYAAVDFQLAPLAPITA